jgi:hypothetical protein
MRNQTGRALNPSDTAVDFALHCVAVGRHNCTFASSDAGGRRAAVGYTLSRRTAGDSDCPAARLREFARKCLEVANTVDSADSRLPLFEMARVWHRLEQEQEQRDRKPPSKD